MSAGSSTSKFEWSKLRLQDRIQPGLRVLFVGINPGVRSAVTGHHFAGYSNRFWKVLSESGLVPEPITYMDDDRLLEAHLFVLPNPSGRNANFSYAEMLDAFVKLRRFAGKRTRLSRQKY